MEIIKLNEIQFRNYAKVHSQRNYFQTVEYGNFITRNKYQKIYLGLIDNKNNVVAACLMCTESIKNKYNIGYVPGGFLLDLKNKELTKTFISLLNDFLKNNNFIFARVYPYFALRVYDKKLRLEKDKEFKVNNLKDNNVLFVNYKSEFSKYHAILSVKNESLTDLYSYLSYKVKREIKKSNLMGIEIYKGISDDIEKFYELVKGNNSKNIEHYKNLMYDFNSDDNSFEIYFAKLDTKKYLNNFINLEKEESEKNDYLNSLLPTNNSKRLLQKKMQSDAKISRYKKEIITATEIHKNYPNGVIVSTVGIIKNNREINFIESGYHKALPKLYTISSIKWEIINKYYNMGYKSFDIGEIPNSLNDKKSPYYGLFVNNSILCNKIIEYSKNYDIVSNKYLYTIYASINTFINSLKK